MGGKQSAARIISIALGASAMSLAPGLSMTVARTARPDATDFFGYLYQLIARTEASYQWEPISACALFLVACWLCRRYLCRKPEDTGIGEYLLCGLFAFGSLAGACMRADGTLSVIWANAFQLCKALLIFAGMYLLFLTALRALGEGLQKLPKLKNPTLPAWVVKRPFWASCAVLFAAWLPHVILKYPGALTWDSAVQLYQIMGRSVRTTAHPPFATAVYGLFFTLGNALGDVNIGYFMATLLQTAGFIAVLAYSLAVMRRFGVSPWVRLAALAIYAISPCYVGWSTVIVKDTVHMIACLLIGVELFVFVKDPKGFFDGWRDPLLMGLGLVTAMLFRHNGVVTAAVALVCMLLSLLGKREKRMARRLLCLAACVAIACGGAYLAVVKTMGFAPSSAKDAFSYFFQQTARVVKLHGDELPPDETEVIDRVLAYDSIGGGYMPSKADSVKNTYRADATSADMLAYLRVWAKQLIRYPLVYADATLAMCQAAYDVGTDVSIFYSITDNEFTDAVFRNSFNDMSLYNRDGTTPLLSAQRMLTEGYINFARLPFLGLLINVAFCVILMLSLLYLGRVRRRAGVATVCLPALVTLIVCVTAMPLLHLRYALPIVSALPLWLGAYCANAAPSAIPTETRP